MAALLTSVTGNTDDVVKYINECREMGIAVEAPDINVSDANFTPHGSAIRFGLAAVKNVGHNAIESIVAGRKELGRFSSIYEFCEKVDLRLLNKRVLESLIKSGAMDGLGPPRPAHGRPRQSHRARAEDAARRRKRPAWPVRRLSGRRSFSGARTSCPILPTGTNTRGWPMRKRFSASSSAAIPWKNIATSWTTCARSRTEEIGALTKSTGKDENITTAGIITNLRVLKSKRGDFYAQGALEDMAGTVEMLVFPEAYRKLQEKVKLEVPVLIRGGVRIEEGANPEADGQRDSFRWKTRRCRCRNSLRIRVPLETANESTVDALHTPLRAAEGRSQGVV